MPLAVSRTLRAVPTAMSRTLPALLLTAAVVGAVAGCGRDAQTVATGPTPSVASSPTPVGGGTGELSPVETATVTAAPATASPARPSATPTRRPTGAPTPKGGVLRLTAADAGRTITVARGDVIVVELSGGPGSYLPPAADDDAVLRTEERRGGYPGTDPATARFTAIGPGVAHISSTTDAACLHSQPACMIPQQQFMATIRVR